MGHGHVGCAAEYVGLVFRGCSAGHKLHPGIRARGGRLPGTPSGGQAACHPLFLQQGMATGADLFQLKVITWAKVRSAALCRCLPSSVGLWGSSGRIQACHKAGEMHISSRSCPPLGVLGMHPVCSKRDNSSLWTALLCLWHVDSGLYKGASLMDKQHCLSSFNVGCVWNSMAMAWVWFGKNIKLTFSNKYVVKTFKIMLSCIIMQSSFIWVVLEDTFRLFFSLLKSPRGPFAGQILCLHELRCQPWAWHWKHAMCWRLAVWEAEKHWYVLHWEIPW